MSDERRWSVSAILIGSVVDIGGSLVFGLVAATAVSATLISQGVAQEELMKHLYSDNGYLIGTMVIGLAFSALGGFVAARMAKRRELQHGGATAGVCVVFSVLMLGASSGLPWWYFAVSYALLPPIALVGAAVGRAKNRRSLRPN